jgi:hypothetical protein
VETSLGPYSPKCLEEFLQPGRVTRSLGELVVDRHSRCDGIR